jgi:hypothetical protein
MTSGNNVSLALTTGKDYATDDLADLAITQLVDACIVLVKAEDESSVSIALFDKLEDVIQAILEHDKATCHACEEDNDEMSYDKTTQSLSLASLNMTVRNVSSAQAKAIMVSLAEARDKQQTRRQSNC